MHEKDAPRGPAVALIVIARVGSSEASTLLLLRSLFLCVTLLWQAMGCCFCVPHVHPSTKKVGTQSGTDEGVYAKELCAHHRRHAKLDKEKTQKQASLLSFLTHKKQELENGIEGTSIHPHNHTHTFVSCFLSSFPQPFKATATHSQSCLDFVHIITILPTYTPPSLPPSLPSSHPILHPRQISLLFLSRTRALNQPYPFLPPSLPPSLVEPPVLLRPGKHCAVWWGGREGGRERRVEGNEGEEHSAGHI